MWLAGSFEHLTKAACLQSPDIHSAGGAQRIANTQHTECVHRDCCLYSYRAAAAAIHCMALWTAIASGLYHQSMAFDCCTCWAFLAPTYQKLEGTTAVNSSRSSWVSLGTPCMTSCVNDMSIVCCIYENILKRNMSQSWSSQDLPLELILSSYSK